MKFLVMVALCVFCTSPARAFNETPVTTENSYTLDAIIEQLPNFTKTPKGGLDWKIFSETKEDPYSIEKDGETWEGFNPIFSDAIKAYDGKKIKMTGFVFPLDETEEQKHFLFGPFPLTCPFHYHVPAALTIEAFAEEPITFSYDAITIEGVLELIPQDLEYNTFYHLNDVKIVE